MMTAQAIEYEMLTGTHGIPNPLLRWGYAEARARCR